MRRRSFLAGVGALVSWPLAREGQQQKLYRIGMLEWTSTAINAANLNAFRQGLRELGYVEGKDFAIEYRSVDSRDELYSHLAAELVRLKVDLILTRGTPAALAAKNATGSIPVIMTSIGDPVGQGVVASLARPGGKELAPQVRRVAILYDVSEFNIRRTEIPTTLGIEVTRFRVDSRQDLERAFASIAGGGIDAIYATGGTVTFGDRRFIVEQALKLRLPAYIVNASAAEVSGLLFSYTADLNWANRRLPFFVDRVLRGTKPADIPIEEPTKFEMIIQPQDGQSARPHDTALAAAAG